MVRSTHWMFGKVFCADDTSRVKATLTYQAENLIQYLNPSEVRGHSK